MNNSNNQYVNSINHPNMNKLNSIIAHETIPPSIKIEIPTPVLRKINKNPHIKENQYGSQELILNKRENSVNDSADIKINIALNINFNLKDHNVNQFYLFLLKIFIQV